LEILKLNGEGPSPRKLSSLNYIDGLHVLVVYGGRYDDNSRNQTFNDIYLLDLINLTWFSVKVYDGIIKARYEHCAVVSGNKIIVFGGMDDEMYIASDLYIITVGKSELIYK